MGVLLIKLSCAVRVTAGELRERLTEEAGEGVISAAIAVLVMAFLGVVMWGLFNGLINEASDKIGDTIQDIGG